MGKGAVTYPVVVVEVNGIRCRALLDTGAGSSYASAALIERLHIRPRRKEQGTAHLSKNMCAKHLGIEFRTNKA